MLNTGMTEQFANNAVSTLNGYIDDSTTTIVVTSANSFPATGNFRIVIDNEIMLVTSVSGNTFTVTRSIENTIATNHLNNAAVTHILTAGAVEQFREDTISTGANSSLPSAGVAGRTYLTTDSVYAYQDNGATWQAFGPIWPLTPMITSNFTASNLGSTATVTTTNGTVNLSDSGGQGTSDAWRLYLMTIPTAPYTITCGFIPTILIAGNSLSSGPAIILSDGTKIIAFGSGYAYGSSNWRTGLLKYSNTSSYNGTYASFSVPSCVPCPVQWYRIHDDGTNYTFSTSNDGYTFYPFYTVSNTDFLTATNIGIGVDNFNSSSGQYSGVTVISWVQS